MLSFSLNTVFDKGLNGSNRESLVLASAGYLFMSHTGQSKPEKNSGLNGIHTHDLCDIGLLSQLVQSCIVELQSSTNSDNKPIGKKNI